MILFNYQNKVIQYKYLQIWSESYNMKLIVYNDYYQANLFYIDHLLQRYLQIWSQIYQQQQKKKKNFFFFF